MAKNNQVLADADSERDKELLQSEETTIELPDVEDIPGQENIHPPVLDEMNDTTASSDDEEGAGIFNDNTSVNDVGSIRNFNEEEPPARITDEADMQELNENDMAADEDDINITDNDADATDADVTTEEKELLQQTSESMAGKDDIEQRAAQLDNTDLDGEELNESVGYSGEDLDAPGTELDDDEEDTGEEDEENNNYSMGDNE